MNNDLDDILEDLDTRYPDSPRGAGDPDVYGYPGEKEEVTHKGRIDKVKVRDNLTRRSNYPFDDEIDYSPEIDEDLEDNFKE